MPTKPLSPCSHPGCPGRATHGGRCATHARRRDRSTEAPRPSAHERGYGAQWRTLRARFLAANPTCAQCGEPATDVDHALAKRAGGTDAWSNLVALCGACHRSKTNAVDGGGWKRKTPPNRV